MDQGNKMILSDVTDTSFEDDVLNAEGLVLVDFWAEWCAPCKQIGPILEEMAQELEGSLSIAKVNIDENPQTPTKYGVRGIPTLIIFKGGQVAGTKVGTAPKGVLMEWVQSLL
jgi:thioredoxin 1